MRRLAIALFAASLAGILPAGAQGAEPDRAFVKDKSVDLDRQPAAKTYLLAVSVKQYNKAHTGFVDLTGAAPDAIHAVNWLCPDDPKNRVAVYLAQYKKEDGYLEPTAEGVRAALKDFAARVTAQDRVVIVMLGHGFHTKKQGDVFCTSDCDFADPNSMILVSEIVARVRAMKAREKLVFIDACRKPLDRYQARDSNGADLTGTDGLPVRKEIVVENGMDKAAKGEVVARPVLKDVTRTIVVQSCKPGQKSYLSECTGKSLMMTRLLRAVEGAADADDSGVVSVGEALEYLRKHVRDDARILKQEVQAIDIRDEGLGEEFDLIPCEKTVRPRFAPKREGDEAALPAPAYKPSPEILDAIRRYLR